MGYDRIVETIYYKLINLKLSYKCVSQFILSHADNFKRIRFHLIDIFVTSCVETICGLTRNGKLNFNKLINDNKKLTKVFDSIIKSKEYKKILEIRNRKIAHIVENKNFKDLEYVIFNFEIVLNQLINLLELCKTELKIDDKEIHYYTQKDFEDFDKELNELSNILFNNWSINSEKEFDNFLKTILTKKDYKRVITNYVNKRKA